MALRLGSLTPSKLYLGSTEVTKAYLGASEVYSSSVGPTLWTPAELGAALALWLDADDSNTITLNGTEVSQWDDKSGNNRDAAQANAALQPTLVASSLNGKPGLDWGSAQNGKCLVIASSFASRFVMGVGDYDGTDPFNQFAAFYVPATTYRPIFTNSSGTTWLSSATCALNGADTGSNIALPTISSPFIVRNVSVTSVNSFANTNIGNDPGSVNRAWRGKIYEVVTLDAAPSTEDRQKLEGYLAWKWGLEGNLPADHPYKSTPPTV